MRALASSVLVVAALALPRTAAAFCGFYVSGADTKLVADASQVVMMREGTRTVLSMQNDYKGPPEDFAMVVPVPVVLQKENVKTLARDVFARIDTLSAPRLVEYWEQDPCSGEGVSLDHIGTLGRGSGMGSSFGAGGRAEAVKVEAKFEVGEYDIVILSSQSSTALHDWLKENKYKLPDDAEPMLRPYVQAGSKFFVAKVNAAKLVLENGVATLSPLRFHYDSEKFELPVRLGLVNSAGKQDLVVQILAPQKRYEVANYPNVTIPTNLDVAASARERFGDFYAALFDDTVAKTPNAIVTEYAWPASNCDPCPGNVGGLAAEDLVALGADVLPSTIASGGAKVTIGGRGASSIAPSLRQGLVQVSGGLPPEIVQRVVRQNFGRFRLCYEQGLRSNPALQGRATLVFTIGKDGTVKSVSDKGSDLPDTQVLACMRRGLQGASFPQPDGEREVSVTYPINLTPGTPGITPGSLGGVAGMSNLPGFVLTRLHARYGKGSLGADLVFREAPPITGGREVRTSEGKLEEGSSKSDTNNFQARYAIRHAWPGPIKCASPRRGQWGGPSSWPDAGVARDTVAVTRTAYAKRDGVTLASFLTSAEVEPATTTPASDAGTVDAGAAPAASSSKCGCRTVGARGETNETNGALALALAFVAHVVRRKRPN